MRARLKWTNLSRRRISREVSELGTPEGDRVVSASLSGHGYRPRQAQEKKSMGQQTDRDAHFRKIGEHLEPQSESPNGWRAA